LKILNNIKTRIWIPYQVGYEYYNNRIGIIEIELTQFDNFIGKLGEFKPLLNIVKKEINKKSSNPHLNSKFIEDIESIVNKEKENIREKKEKYSDLLKNDTIEREIAILFENNVGEQFNNEKLEEIYKEGELRFKNGIPPGFEDSKSKTGIRIYGDLIIWFEMIKKSSELKKSIIFITDDLKNDWWKTYKNKKLNSPRPELIIEFDQKCNQKFYMYDSYQFMYLSQKYLKQKVDPNSIEEAKETRDENYLLKKIFSFYSTNNLNFDLKSKIVDVTKTPVSDSTSPKIELKSIDDTWNDFLNVKINDLKKDSNSNELEDTSEDM